VLLLLLLLGGGGGAEEERGGGGALRSAPPTPVWSPPLLRAEVWGGPLGAAPGPGFSHAHIPPGAVEVGVYLPRGGVELEVVSPPPGASRRMCVFVRTMAPPRGPAPSSFLIGGFVLPWPRLNLLTSSSAMLTSCLPSGMGHMTDPFLWGVRGGAKFQPISCPALPGGAGFVVHCGRG